MSNEGRAVGSFPAQDPCGVRYEVLVYELPTQTARDGMWRPILQRRFVTSEGHKLEQMSSTTFRVLPDGPTLRAAT